ncbi:MAG: GNAT family N-acetyltransferase [Bacteroidota bacterium]
MDIHIETERLYIRKLIAADDKGMFAMDSDPEVHKYIGGKPVESIERSREVIEIIRSQYQEFGIGRWAIIEKSSGDFVGWIGHKRMTETVNGHCNHIDFGYRLARRFWGQGYATEAGRASLQYGIDTLQLKDIYAMTDVDNAASRRILEKLGFTFMGLFEWNGPSTWRQEGESTTWYQLLQ